MKAHGFKLCCCWACVLMLISVCLRDDWQFCLAVSNHYTFATVYMEDTFTKEISVIDESVHVTVGLQLLEMSSITIVNQTISNVCTGTFFRVLF